MADVALGLPEAGAADFLANSIYVACPDSRPTAASYAHHVARYAPCRASHAGRSLRPALRRSASVPTEPVLIGDLLSAAARSEAIAGTRRWLGVGPRSNALITSGFRQARRPSIRHRTGRRCCKQPPLQGNIVRILIDRQKPEAVRIAALARTGVVRPEAIDRHAGVPAGGCDGIDSHSARKSPNRWPASTLPKRGLPLLATLPTAPARLASTIAAGLGRLRRRGHRPARRRRRRQGVAAAVAGAAGAGQARCPQAAGTSRSGSRS